MLESVLLLLPPDPVPWAALLAPLLSRRLTRLSLSDMLPLQPQELALLLLPLPTCSHLHHLKLGSRSVAAAMQEVKAWLGAPSPVLRR